MIKILTTQSKIVVNIANLEEWSRYWQFWGTYTVPVPLFNKIIIFWLITKLCLTLLLRRFGFTYKIPWCKLQGSCANSSHKSKASHRANEMPSSQQTIPCVQKKHKWRICFQAKIFFLAGLHCSYPCTITVIMTRRSFFSLNKNILLGYEQRGFKSLSISSCAAFCQWRIDEKCVYSSFGEAHFQGKG